MLLLGSCNRSMKICGGALAKFLFAAGFLFVFFVSAHSVQAATYTVTSTDDVTDDCTSLTPAAGSLREAILAANGNAGTDTIDFNVALAGATLTLECTLPFITEATVIDGTTLTNVQSGPDITIAGSTVFTAIIEFLNTDSGNVIKGIAISGGYYGIYAVGTTGITIGGSAAGTGNWVDGAYNSGIKLENDANSIVRGNTVGGTVGQMVGINVIGSTSLTMGGTGANDGNVTINNTFAGMALSGVTTVLIQGNKTGIKADGLTAAANLGYGLFFDGTNDGVTIGGTSASARNIISGNTSVGLLIVQDNNTNILVEGNYFGTNAAGDAAVPNGGVGLESNSVITIGGTAAGAGNVISGNSGAQILLANAGATTEVANVTGSTVLGNIIGLNAAGDAIIVGNAGYGIQIQNSNNIIGGSAAGARNIISGNTSHGILIFGSGLVTAGNVIQGNFIGLSKDGTADQGNGLNGININTAARETQIGGTGVGEGNVISGNTGHGIQIENYAGTGNIIEGNIIGLSSNATVALGNTGYGIDVSSDSNTVGGVTTASRNIICSNVGGGVIVAGDSSDNNSTGNIIENNYVGTADGTDDFGNDGPGIAFVQNVYGNSVLKNIVVGNGVHGIYMAEATVHDITVQGNYIGVLADGSTALGNTSSGIVAQGNSIIGGTGVGEGNVIANNTDIGILLVGNGGSTVLGNMIGVTADGSTDAGNGSDGIQIISSNNTIGGTTASARNIISGGGRLGIFIYGAAAAEHNVVQGNYIGLNAAGTSAIPNAEHGISIVGALALNNTIGGTVAGAGNVISGNSESGINIEGDGGSETVAGNYFGLNAAGTAAIANANAGIRMNSSNNIIGGTVAGARNIISGNTTQGILIFGTSVGNTFEGNYIGTNAAGTAAVANGDVGIYVLNASTANFIGVAGYGNVISGNATRGILIQGDTADNNSIQGNIVGLGANGSTIIGNGAAGIVIIGADGTLIGTANSATARNVVSGNSDIGIWLYSDVTGTVVADNYIGLASDGATAKVNTSYGVRIEAASPSNIIGGTANGAGNTINVIDTSSCVYLTADSGDYNNVRHNNCLNEGATIMNITRDGTSNESIATPAITSLTATTSYVEGTSSTASGAVDIFVNGSYSTSVAADGSGNWSKAFSLASGSKVSASITNGTLSTSATSTPQVTVADDVTNPAISVLSPADGATGVSVSANLVIMFSEAVTVQTGNIVIKKTSDNSTVETIAVTDGAKVTGSGTSTITINPTVTLGALVGYYVQIAATAFDDHSGNSYAGLADTTSWNFTTTGTAGIVVTESSGTTAVEEGGITDSYTVVMSTEPAANVVIAIASTTGDTSTSPTSLTFTIADWATPQTVTVTAVDDSIPEMHDSDTITHTVTSTDPNYNGFSVAAVSVSIADSDQHHGSAPVDPRTTEAKTITVVTPVSGTNVQARATLNVAWNYTGIIPVTNIYLSTDAGATWTRMVSNITNNGSTSFTAPATATSHAIVKVEGTDLATVLATGLSAEFTIVSVATPATPVTETPTTPAEVSPVATAPAALQPTMLVKLPDDGNLATQADSCVYFIGTDGARHAFPNPKVYFTWYGSFTNVVIVSAETMATLPLGHNVTYKPGAIMVKFESSPQVYAVSRHAVLMPVTSEVVAARLYGSAWNTKIDDISSAFSADYTISATTAAAADFSADGFADVLSPDDSL